MMCSWPCLTGSVEITRYDNPSGALSEFYEGQKIGEIWGYETVGIFQTQEEVDNAPNQAIIGANWRPGDIRYADLDGDGIISPGSRTLEDPGDRRIIGQQHPRGSFGINSGISFKGFRLATFFQGILKRDHWPTSGNWTWFFPFNSGHVEEYFIADSWSEDNRMPISLPPTFLPAIKKTYRPRAGFYRTPVTSGSKTLP